MVCVIKKEDVNHIKNDSILSIRHLYRECEYSVHNVLFCCMLISQNTLILILVHHLRCWPNIKPILAQCWVSTTLMSNLPTKTLAPGGSILAKLRQFPRHRRKFHDKQILVGVVCIGIDGICTLHKI